MPYIQAISSCLATDSFIVAHVVLVVADSEASWARYLSVLTTPLPSGLTSDTECPTEWEVAMLTPQHERGERDGGSGPIAPLDLGTWAGYEADVKTNAACSGACVRDAFVLNAYHIAPSRLNVCTRPRTRTGKRCMFAAGY